jgi:hypothetical protein
MTEARVLRLLDYSDLIAVVDYRTCELGLRQLEIDDLAGLQQGYTGKILRGDRNFDLMSLQGLLGALKLDLFFWHRRTGRALPASWGSNCVQATIPVLKADVPTFMQKLGRLSDAIGLRSFELNRVGGRNDVLRATLAFDKRAIVPDGLPRLRDVLGSDLILVPRSESSPTERRAISATAARRPERRAQSPTGEC